MALYRLDSNGFLFDALLVLGIEERDSNYKNLIVDNESMNNRYPMSIDTFNSLNIQVGDLITADTQPISIDEASSATTGDDQINTVPDTDATPYNPEQPDEQGA